MKFITLILALLAFEPSCASGFAQSLVVHAIDQESGKPLSGVPVTIRYNFMELRKAKKGEVQTVNSDAEGKALFPKLALTAGGFEVFVFSMRFQGVGLQPVFVSPEAVSKVRLDNPIVTSLPAEVSIQVHKQSFKETLELIYPGP